MAGCRSRVGQLRRAHRAIGVVRLSPGKRFIARCHRRNGGEHCKHSERRTANYDRFSQNTSDRQAVCAAGSPLLSVSMSPATCARIRFPRPARSASATRSRYYVASHNGAVCSAKPTDHTHAGGARLLPLAYSFTVYYARTLPIRSSHCDVG